MEQAPLFVAVASEVASCFGDAPPRIEDGTSLQITCAAALILPTGQYAAWCLHRTEERLAACDINELGMMLKNHVAAMDEVWVECHTRVINALGLTNEEVASMVDPALNAPKAKSQAHVLVYRLSQADQIKTEFRERLEQAIAQKENDAWDYFANTFGDYMSGVRQTLVGSIKTACSATPPSDPRDALIKYGSEAYAMLSEDPEDKSPSMVMQVHAAWASLKVAVRVVEEATEAKLMGFEGMLTKRKDRKELRAKAKDAMGFVVALVALFRPEQPGTMRAAVCAKALLGLKKVVPGIGALRVPMPELEALLKETADDEGQVRIPLKAAKAEAAEEGEEIPARRY